MHRLSTAFDLVCWLASTRTALAGIVPLPTADYYLIDSLPLFNSSEDITFKQYSGYMPLGDSDESAFFFWFVESQNDPSTDPVALWLNGGPGSSSIDLGFWQEHGPYRLTSDAQAVNLNPFSWNRIASVIYLESPSGVGFSYSNKSTGYNCSDSKSAELNYLFLKQFFKVFSNFTTQDFYLTGESYGGHYVPELAMEIINHQNDTDGGASLYKNMKGFLIGNPAINSDWYYNTNEYAFLSLLYSHALLPQTAYMNVYNICQWDQFLTNCSRDFTHPTQECWNASQAAWQYIPEVMDPYNIYAPTCSDDELKSVNNKKHLGSMPRRYFAFENHPGNSVSGREFVKKYTPWLEKKKSMYGLNAVDYVYNPCMGDWDPTYMNMESVMDALHANTQYNSSRNGVWPNTPNDWTYGSETQDIALLFPTFFEKAPQWKITVVSGDADAAVPFVGTQRWVECLGQKVVTDWKDWYFYDGFNNDVGGVVKVYDGLVLQTVKGCGHTIPSYCPTQGFLFFQDFLNGTFL